MTDILIPVPQTPLIDMRTGLLTREWYRYFSLVQEATGGSTNTIIDVLLLDGAPVVPELGPTNRLAMEADSYGSQNAGEIEALRKTLFGVAALIPGPTEQVIPSLNPQIPGPVEFAQTEAALRALTPFGSPPIETGSLEAAKNGGYRIVEAGNAVLVVGTVTVNSVNAVSTNEFSLTTKAIGGTQGMLSVGTITANTSFVINSSNALDTSTVSWVIYSKIRG